MPCGDKRSIFSDGQMFPCHSHVHFSNAFSFHVKRSHVSFIENCELPLAPKLLPVPPPLPPFQPPQDRLPQAPVISHTVNILIPPLPPVATAPPHQYHPAQFNIGFLLLSLSSSRSASFFFLPTFSLRCHGIGDIFKNVDS